MKYVRGQHQFNAKQIFQQKDSMKDGEKQQQHSTLNVSGAHRIA